MAKNKVKGGVAGALEYLYSKNKDAQAFGADQDFTLSYESYKTSSPALNDITGVDGLPAGRIIQFAGMEGSGKTLMTLDIIKQAQESDPEAWAVFVDAEFTFDKAWATKLGIDLSRLVVLRKNNAREIWFDLIGDPSKKDAPGLLGLADQDPENNKLKIIVVDSIAALVSPSEELAEPGKVNVGGLARFLSLELKKVTPVLSRTGVDLIGINQSREKIGVMYGDPMTSPGGRAWKHACSIMINFLQLNNKDSAIYDDSGAKIGHKIKCRLDKNKVGPGFKTAQVTIEYEKGLVNTEVEWVQLGIKYGVVERSGSYFRYRDGNCQGEKKFVDYLKNNNLLDQLQADIQEAKKTFKEAPLESLSLEDLLTRAEELSLSIPEKDKSDREAVLAHIESLAEVPPSEPNPDFN